MLINPICRASGGLKTTTTPTPQPQNIMPNNHYADATQRFQRNFPRSPMI